MSLANEIDDRTVEQQLRDLGVKIVRKNTNNTVTGVKWVKKGAHKKPKKPWVTVSSRSMYFNIATEGLLNNYAAKYNFGVGDYKGHKVLIMTENPKGYTITKRKSGGGIISNKALTGWLLDNGLKRGRYNLKAIKGGYMGVPAE